MNPSPIGSKLLSGYAVLFAGLAPLATAIVGVTQGMGLFLLANAVLGGTIAYYGVRVFMGHYSVVKTFALLVILHYLGITFTNYMLSNEFPEGSRAAEMAVPRMVRGVVFAGVYAWYYFARSKTAEGFSVSS